MARRFMIVELEEPNDGSGCAGLLVVLGIIWLFSKC